MAKQHGVPGEWARVRGVVLSLWPLFLSFSFLGAFVSAAVTRSHLVMWLVLTAISAIMVVVMWMKGLSRVLSFFIGARGEERVAAIIGTLPDSYSLFNDFVSGHDHVDHVLVGPAGIFVIETKFWRGKVTVEDDTVLVDGKLPSRTPTVQARREAGVVAKAISKCGIDVEVVPVVCFASDTFEPGVKTVDGCVVLNSSKITVWIGERPEVLTEQMSKRFAQLMEE